jgi:hypothetical protein
MQQGVKMAFVTQRIARVVHVAELQHLLSSSSTEARMQQDKRHEQSKGCSCG